MENQHRQIKGYRELNQVEIDMMNTIKEAGQMIGNLVDFMDSTPDHFDMRWVAIGKTHLQQGLMALTRAVAKPDFF